ncbi:hypothetical protein [Clostridium botulinum]|uniref:hypothetical protein n=1 Tax=Clostridium botulinum TaxID=1491 RepID=UPI000465D376|nr:hypothetical protein [Clostridium botulinum]APQ74199.1 hypothetical protein RSJ9_2472 [Clostridium botulinum]
MEINDFNIIRVIDSIKEKRKVFHSEADFQFVLTWEIRKLYPDADVRLEYAYKIDDKIYHIDILVMIEGEFISIELKYKTLKKSLIVNNEEFTLRNHGAQDLGKYDFIKDIVRLETLLLEDSKFVKGYVIMITNDPSYWNGITRKNTCCADFDIRNDKEIKGSLNWAEHASAGTMKNREKPLVLLGEYKMKWHDYSCFDEKRNGKFKYLAVKVLI